MEDDKDIFTLWTDFLSRKGYNIVNKYSDEIELQIFEIGKPDLYIIDYKLPGTKNGIDIALDILNENPSVLILFITAYEVNDNESSKHSILNNNRVAFLLKPVKLIQIEYSILELLKKR